MISICEADHFQKVVHFNQHKYRCCPGLGFILNFGLDLGLCFGVGVGLDLGLLTN